MTFEATRPGVREGVARVIFMGSNMWFLRQRRNWVDFRGVSAYGSGGADELLG